MTVVDLFAGPGGWDLGARDLGLDPLGIEWDDDACATRRAAGLRTHQHDVATLDPALFRDVEGLIASPPCQSFSSAGKGGGRDDTPDLIVALARIAAGEDPRAEYRPRMADERSLLVVEPLRWALALRPRWIAMEQVPGVIDLWRHTAGHLERAGYSTWCGVLNAADFGVPQTRQRAILIASLDGRVTVPPPTHADARRGIPMGYLPWVSMAEALGWGEGDLVGFPRRNDTPSNKPAPGDQGEYRERDLRPATEPALNITEKARSWSRSYDVRQTGHQIRQGDDPAPTLTAGGLAGGVHVWRVEDVELVNGNQPNACARSADEPAGTLFFGERLNEVAWRLRGSGQENATERAADEPAPTLVGGHGAFPEWVHDRPATTVAGDPRVHPPGHKTNRHDPPGKYEGRAGKNAVRVTIEEAAILQGFPADYPWQGSRSSQFRQVGNAVPPPLARAILAAVTAVRAAA